jgi:hypothetical protein
MHKFIDETIFYDLKLQQKLCEDEIDKLVHQSFFSGGK